MCSLKYLAEFNGNTRSLKGVTSPGESAGGEGGEDKHLPIHSLKTAWGGRASVETLESI